ncbi:CDP-alcohol phosphatidyltransferase family protein [Egibacter rhizosphaerae]|nr:CDP-alcohol phosphatidyltransferase family protein [Egibacter rhizosphaerae]
MREHLNFPNLITSVSLSAGFAALLLVPARPLAATILVVVAAALDGVDGWLARRRGGDLTFGAQLDSLSDLLCFCVVPAFALYQVAEPLTASAGSIIAGLFLLAGAWRLARFALLQRRDHFVGLPTPAAGILVMLLAFWTPVVPALLGTALLATLMASTLRFPTVATAAAVVRSGRPGGRS